MTPEEIRRSALEAKPPTETVACPEWGCEVLVRGMSAREVHEFESAPADDDQLNACRMTALCALSADGERVFSEDDIRALGEGDPRPIARIANTVRRLCGVDDELEDHEKN